MRGRGQERPGGLGEEGLEGGTRHRFNLSYVGLPHRGGSHPWAEISVERSNHLPVPSPSNARKSRRRRQRPAATSGGEQHVKLWSGSVSVERPLTGP